MQRATAMLVALCLVFLATACKEEPVDYYSPYDHDFGHVIEAEIVFKDYGTVKLSLLPDAAPITVDNFVSLANSGFYDGLIIHRVVKGFCIQGGDPTGTGYGSSDQKKIQGEFSSNGMANSISHVRGILSMARNSQSMDSATSQFFILLSDNTQKDYLNGNYAAFGCVSDGMDIIDRIAELEVSEANARPLEPPVIETVRILSPIEAIDNQ